MQRLFSRTKTKTRHKKSSTCSCPACTGLVCMERPRFFAGQLLTESELNSLERYVMAKNRLHNRYLHGSGVVCGLEVSCHECEGWVTVGAGYAIDPCGNDVILCEKHDFDVIKAIRECRNTRRREDCDPVRPARDEQCDECPETWCITLTYLEKEARPRTTLRNGKNGSQAQCSCGCGCGGGVGCSCQSHDYAAEAYTRTSTSTRSGTGQTVTACEPTRVVETYRLAVVPAPPDYCMPDRDDLLEGTLLGRIMACVQSILDFVQRRGMKTTDFETLGPAYTSSGVVAGVPPVAGVDVNANDQHTALCRFTQAIRALYLENPLNVSCSLLDTLNQLDCPPPFQNEGLLDYSARIRQPVYDLTGLLVQYLIDCVCQALLPPCPPNPEENCLILACFTVQDDQILRICNFGCRDYAGAFPTLNYWLSLIPIVPLIKGFITQMCCSPELVRARSPLVNDFLRILDRVDPTGRIREAVFEDGFALPRLYADQLQGGLARLTLDNLVGRVTPKPDAVNMAVMVEKPVDEVIAAGQVSQVEFETHEVQSRAEVPAFAMTARPFAAPGDRYVIYTLRNRVVGYAPAAEVRAAAQQHELDDLRAELGYMREEMAKLRRSRTTKGKE